VPDWTAGLHAGRHGHGGKEKDMGATPADATDASKDDKDHAANLTAAIAATPAITPAIPLPDVNPDASAASLIGSAIDAQASADQTKNTGTPDAAAHGGGAPRHGGHHAGGAHRAAPATDVADLVTTGTATTAAQDAGQIVSDVAEAAGAGVGAANADATSTPAPKAAAAPQPQPAATTTSKPAVSAAAPAARRQGNPGASLATRQLVDAAAKGATPNQQDAPASATGASNASTQAAASNADAARTPPPAQTPVNDRTNAQERTATNRQDAGERSARTNNVSVTAATTAAIRAAAQNTGTGSHDPQSGSGAGAPPATPQPAAAASPATVAFGLDSGSLASAGSTAAPLQASADATTWSGGELPESTVNQIVQAIRLQWTNGTGEARIKLEPEQFGDVTVSVRVERGQVSARVEADTPVVREWLQSNQQTLRHGLAEQNLTLDRLEVAAPPASRDAESRDSDRQRGGGDQPPSRRRPRQPQGQETFEVVA
jgi:flagellar hook-length control protein FliK